jgi:hypothetical protein
MPVAPESLKIIGSPEKHMENFDFLCSIIISRSRNRVDATATSAGYFFQFIPGFRSVLVGYMGSTVGYSNYNICTVLYLVPRD